ncbi:MAG: serine O-acetyltransferase [Actinomycetes bacterium]
MLSRFKRDLRAVVERDPAARTQWEVALLYPGLHALWAHRASHWLWGKGALFPARALSQTARWATGIEIHPGAQIGEGLFIDHGAAVVIGETAEIGNDVTIYHGVTLGGTSLDPGKRHPTIGDRVIIGAGAKLLGNLKVGDDSRIGANAVLVRSVAEHSIVVGVPGQVLASGADPASSGRGKSDPDPVTRALQSLLARVDALEDSISGTHAMSELYLNSSGEWQEADFVI